MDPDQAEAKLRSLVHEAGIDVDGGRFGAGDVVTCWEVFKRFGTIDVTGMDRAGDDDGLLFQYGPNWERENSEFEVSMVRQFTFYASGEYDGMAQLNLQVVLGATDESLSLGSSNLWSFGLELDEFFARVERLPGYRFAAESGGRPLSIAIDYSPV